MKQKRIYIDIYSYTLYYIDMESYDNLDKVIKIYKRLKLGQENIDDLKTKAKNEAIGGATTFHKANSCQLVIVLYPQPSEERKIECIYHEKRHCEDFILDTLNIHDDEAAAYLAGYLARKLM